ncbi:MAG: urease accessory protein UreD [Gammaproteobacteria bacterium]|nr:MAG: urease accessory protein UreD [Gammaproteobacteria bacterium]
MSTLLSEKNWKAHLSLVFQQRAAKTVLAHRKHLGPLVVQKPFYPEGDVCHVYLLHPPGGVVGGDELQLDVKLQQQAHALMTTPAAGKFYRSDGRVAHLNQQLNVEDDSVLEWLPQETILFSACNVHMTTRVSLQGRAKFIGWEILCLGRPASGERFDQGYARQHFEIWREQQPLLIDRARLEGGSEVLQASWGMRSFTVTGTLIATHADKVVLDEVRAHIEHAEQGLFSATLMDDVLVIRALTQQAEHVRQQFIELWKIIRPQLLQRAACPPRIWAT